ncbi:MAG: SUMF1/EgtB/PvdO family nonheme iron enzyme [Candidatus Accumulibacter phosphatis]|uniref:SUMF1/EgtB/PvdO family nonheme iron enzyme n=1 Tax=Candidatus Accumulibacter phosphatis TaxID=327160 RepID=UPI001A61B2A1|nr:SUMF1/EgtB/PvdO family nonheme iron enzyme [Candidatus Accumulibacter phosphatis]
MSHRFENAFALLIAVDQNKEASAALPAVAADARALRDVLVHPARCGYAADKLRLLTGIESTRQGVFDGLDWLADELAAIPDGDSTAIIYFSGHGYVEGNEHYLIPYDLNLRRTRTSAIRASDFADVVARLTPRRLLVVLDCCHAAGMGVKQAAPVPAAFASAAIPPALFPLEAKSLAADRLAGGAGRAVLSSCQPGESSYVRADGRMSIFTFHLIEALTGHAQPSGGAPEVLVSDLASHLQRAVRQSTLAQHGAEQNPVPQLTGNFPVALLLGGDGLGKGQAAPDPLAPLPPVASWQATVSGSGAAAQAGGNALGERANQVGGDNSGTIVSGTQIVSNYYHYHLAAGGSAPSRDAIARPVAGYLRWLQERTQSIELRGIERAGGAAVVVLPLETAYVPLRARSLPRPGQAPERIGKPGEARRQRALEFADTAAAGEPSGSEADIAVSEVLGLGNRLAIIGAPGCGKTTVLLHMAWALASSLLAGQPEPARSRLGLTMAADELPLPILVPLASFARYRRHLPAAAPPREKTLAHFISSHLISREAPFDLPVDFFVRLLDEGRNVLLLLDGLDEVANEGERAEVRQSVQDLVCGRPALRVVVTCRTIAYRSGGTALGADFREILVQALDHAQHIAPMVRQAYACIHPQDSVRRLERADDLLTGIRQLEADRRRRLSENAAALVDSPLMVRLLLIVHLNNRALPDQRADLFDKAINALLQVDYGRDESDNRELSADWTLYRDMAQQLAFRMHQQGTDQGREIEEPALRAILRAEPEFQPRLDDFVRHARQRGSVLEERDGAYRFLHLALQEFLVARYLSEVIGRDSREAMLSFLAERIEDSWWREPILLLAGYQATHAARSARDFLRALAETGSVGNAQFSAAELAATAALEWRESGELLRNDCARRIVTLLSDADALATSRPTVRARAGDRLAQLGDPRFDAQRCHLPADDMLGFVRIAADPGFVIGTRRQDAARVAKNMKRKVGDDEINHTPTPTPEFYIARYPVTVAQFRTFVEATGFAIGDAYADALADADSRPVRWVSWHEALAWCDWLNEVLTQGRSFAGSPIARLVREHGWRVALPSELEWEKAARSGLSAAVFPWGDDADPNGANHGDSGIGDTSAVGCFAANGFGLFDMVGNVWEWTRSLYLDYPYDPADPNREDLLSGNDVFRVVRGGSWINPRDFARCAYRHGNHPGLRYRGLGFRVVLRSSPVP